MKTAAPDHGNTRSRGASPLTRVAIMLIVPALLVAVIACDSGSGGSGNSGQGSATTARAPYQDVPEGKPKNLNKVPDPKEVLETAAAGQLPSFVTKGTGTLAAKTEALYKGAVANLNDFQYIPCYCGCAVYAHPHQSLSDCYVHMVKSDGSIEFTDHSLSCDICQGIAQMTLDSLAQHTPLHDIRAAVFKQFSYTRIWTDTPPVPSGK